MTSTDKLKGLTRIDDAFGLNYLNQSRLKSFYRKGTSAMFSIKYVLSGTEHYNINEQQYELTDNNFIITYPQQEIEVYIDSVTDAVGVCYYFDETILQQIFYAKNNSVEANLENIESKKKLLVNETTKEYIHNIPVHSFRTSLNNYLQKTNFEELDKYQISDFLMLIAEHLVIHQTQINDQLNDLNSTKTTTKKELYKRLQKGRQYIHDSFQQPVTIKDMAKAACLSEYYFHRNFRIFFNQTPHQYLQFVRLSQAHQLLKNNRYSKKEVAYNCGFDDVKYFSKVYNKWIRFNTQTYQGN